MILAVFLSALSVLVALFWPADPESALRWQPAAAASRRIAVLIVVLSIIWGIVWATGAWT